MARKAREKSELGIYLVTLKSVDDVLFNADDKINFLNILRKNQTTLLSYTMLNNSFLFVIKEKDKAIDVILRQASIKFVKKYNKLYDRQGKVFAGRYVSYASHTMNDVWKFIANTHELASYNTDAISSSDNYFENSYIDYNYTLRFFDSKADFFELCNNLNTNGKGIKLSDEEIANYIINTFQVQPHNIAKMPQTLLENTVYQIFKTTKASARQVARITSLPLRLLWGVAKKLKPKTPPKVSKNEIGSK